MMEEDSNDKSNHNNGDLLIKSEEIYIKDEEDDEYNNIETIDSQSPNSRKFKCNLCGFRTRHKFSLDAHRKVHVGRSPFKEWSNILSIQLIEEYKKNEVIWNPKHPFYYSKLKKTEAWESIVQNLNVPGLDIDEVQKKSNSLLSSFRREKAKIRKGVESGQGYVSKWFAFEHMQFLLDRNGTRFNVSANISSDSDDTDDEADSVMKLDSDAIESEEVLEDIPLQESHHRKRALETPTSPVSKQKKKMKVSSSSTDLFFEMVRRVSDPESVYSQYIAHKLRKYSPRTRAFVEHAISNVLFEADMGKFEQAPVNM